jgi:S-layer protein (TIGR01567 family)
MKSFIAIAMAALMVLSFVSVASAADTVEIRSIVFEGDNLTDLTTTGFVQTNFTDFAAFYYDLDAGVGSETIRIFTDAGNVSGERTIDAGGMEYYADIQNVSFADSTYLAEYDMDGTGSGLVGEYDKIGFFAEEYVPINRDASLLSKLIIDSDDKFTLRVGQTLELGDGFAITPKQIDVEGNKVWIELTKDGKFLDDDVIDAASGKITDRIYAYTADVAGETDVPLVLVHVKEVFQGQVDSLAIIEGFWAISDEVMEIESDDTFGEFEVESLANGLFGANGLTLKNEDSLSLTDDTVVDLADGLSIRVADTDDGSLRFYFAKEYTEPGTYEVRGEVKTASAIWTSSNFAGFYYDLDANVSSETLVVTESDRDIAVKGVVYTTTIQNVTFEDGTYLAEYDIDGDTGLAGEYDKIGFFAEEYVPIAGNPDILSKLIVDSDDKMTLRVGQTVELGDGFAITPKQIDVEGNKVWIELTKDGKFLDDDVIDAASGKITDRIYAYTADVAGETDVPLVLVHVKEVFQGQVDSLAIIEGYWAISDEVMEIESGDTFGEFEVSIKVDSLVMENDGTLTLTADSVIELAEGLSLRVADDDANLRYFPFVERTIGEVDEAPEEPVDVTPEEPVDVTPEEPVNVTPEEPVNVTPEEPVEPVEPVDDDEDVPGFEAVFAIAGLLAVAFFVRRN